jgi:membrane protease subunit HflK
MFGWTRIAMALAVIAVLAAWIAAGLYTVQADERAVVLRFGAVVDRTGPGMHWNLPWPLGQVATVKTTTVMKTGIGLATSGANGSTSPLELVTGDTNLVNVAVTIQYAIGEPADYLFATENPQHLIVGVAQAILTETAAMMPVDEILTTGRVAIQDGLRQRLQESLDRYRSGIRVVAVAINSISVDRTVAQAFQEVGDAQADRERKRNEAFAYRNTILPKARGEARARLAEAQGYKQQRIAEAAGEAGRVAAVVAEYDNGPDITRARLYLETLSSVLAKVKLHVIDTRGGHDPITLHAAPP